MGFVFAPDRCLQVHPERLDWQRIRRAALAIRRGEVIAIPTDTVYGLAADPFQIKAVEKIFRMKQRPASKPVLLLIASLASLRELAANIPASFDAIAKAFWPGRLTVILPAGKRVPRVVTGGTGTVAVRLPASPVVRALVRASGRPLTGTSANIPGRPAARTAAEVADQLGNSVYYVVDSGRARSARPSTILDLSGRPRIVRAGAISEAELAKYLR